MIDFIGDIHGHADKLEIVKSMVDSFLSNLIVRNPNPFFIRRYVDKRMLKHRTHSTSFHPHLTMKTIFLLLSLNLAFAVSKFDGVPFTLKNTSLVSIPLEIPGVMNPNLNPLSTSGVTLDIGQKVFFKYKKKRFLLLEVNSDLKGQTLDVPMLIRERKKVLKLSEE